MKRIGLIASAVTASLTTAVFADNVYILSSGDPSTDNAASLALTSRGHTVTIGLQYGAFDGSANLTGFDSVYLQCNANWTAASTMPAAGQQQLIDWVNAGGRLVTSEWVTYYSYTGGGKFEALGTILPGEHDFSYALTASATYTQVTPDPQINAGLPAEFTFPMEDPGGLYGGGSETFTTAKVGANVYYTTNNSPGAAGLVGWTVGSGSVFSIMSTGSPIQMADSRFGLLFSNVIDNPGSECYPDCNKSGTLTIADFGCFQAAFAAGEPYADCNNSTTLTIADFGCFQAAFGAGCP
jgi:hypothetical protein